MSEQGARSRPARAARTWFAVGALVAAAVVAVFATVGDGVAPAEDAGVRGLVVDHAHLATWVCLASALAVAAVRGRWTTPSRWLAAAGGVLYAAFLVAVLVLP